jgi:hypothetical protein
VARRAGFEVQTVLIGASFHYTCDDRFRSPEWRSRTLVAGPHILTVIVRPYPARADAVIPPTAMPEMPPVSTRECAPVKSRPDVYGGPAPSRDVPSPEMSGRNVSAATKVSATKVAATKVAAAMTTAMTTAAVGRGSIGGER